jgi:hypothetical protein
MLLQTGYYYLEKYQKMRLGTIANLQAIDPLRSWPTQPGPTKEVAMAPDAIRSKRLIALFLLGFLLLNDPLLSLFNRPEMAWGIPLLFGYIFGVWLLLIVLVMLIVRSGSQSP